MKTLNNSVRLLGNVGMEPQIINFDNGNKLAKFSLETKEHHLNENGKAIMQIVWHHLIIWNKGADLIQTYVKNGAKLAIDGQVVFKKYIDANNNERAVKEILINNFSMLGLKKEAKLTSPIPSNPEFIA